METCLDVILTICDLIYFGKGQTLQQFLCIPFVLFLIRTGCNTAQRFHYVNLMHSLTVDLITALHPKRNLLIFFGLILTEFIIWISDSRIKQFVMVNCLNLAVLSRRHYQFWVYKRLPPFFCITSGAVSVVIFPFIQEQVLSASFTFIQQLHQGIMVSSQGMRWGYLNLRRYAPGNQQTWGRIITKLEVESLNKSNGNRMDRMSVNCEPDRIRVNLAKPSSPLTRIMGLLSPLPVVHFSDLHFLR